MYAACPGNAAIPPLGGRVDYRASALFEHLPDFAAHAVPDAFEVNRDSPVEFGVRNFRHRLLRGLYSGVVERRVEAPELSGYPFDHFFHFARVRYVAGEGLRFQPRFGEFPRLFFGPVYVGEHRYRSGAGERFGAREPYPLRRPRDEGYFAFHVFHCAILSRLFCAPDSTMNAPRGKCAPFSIYCTFLSIGFRAARIFRGGRNAGAPALTGKRRKPAGFRGAGQGNFKFRNPALLCRIGMRAAGRLPLRGIAGDFRVAAFAVEAHGNQPRDAALLHRDPVYRPGG